MTTLETLEHARQPAGAISSMAAIRSARAESWIALGHIAAGIRPGMTERQACELAGGFLEAHEAQRHRHPAIVRFGEGTSKASSEPSRPGRVLGEKDIFLVDIAAVWEGRPGHAGDTFVAGDDPDMHACADAARTLWREVGEHWRRHAADGRALHAYAVERADAQGWRLDLDIDRHRADGLPCTLHRPGALGDARSHPGTGMLWVLEVRIAHPSRPFGAFYKDLVLPDEEMD